MAKKKVNSKVVLILFSIVLAILFGVGSWFVVRSFLQTQGRQQTTEPAQIPPQMAKTSELLQSGKTDEAITYIQQEVANDSTPDDVKIELHKQLGFIFYKKGEAQKALESYEAAFAVEQRYELALSVGSMWLQLGDRQKAREYYNLAITLIPADDPLYESEKQAIEMQLEQVIGEGQ